MAVLKTSEDCFACSLSAVCSLQSPARLLYDTLATSSSRRLGVSASPRYNTYGLPTYTTYLLPTTYLST
jgi:hypothetical protein